MGVLAAARPPRRRVFYGWWIVLACGLIQFLGAGLFYYGLGAFFLPLTAEFGWSRTLTSTAFSLHRLEGGVIAPFVGFAFDRFGPRKLAAFGVALLAGGFLVLSRVDSFPLFVVAVLVMSTGYGTGFTANTMAAVANWFARRRALALGVVFTGSGLGGLLVPLLVQRIDAVGWRSAALSVGVLLLCLGVPLALALRRSPEACGLLPDGDPEPAATVEAPDEPKLGLRTILRTRAFWLLALATSLATASQSALVVHAIPHLAATGLDQALAAGAVGAMSSLSVAGRLGFGWLGDRLSKRSLLAIVLALQSAGLLVFAGLTQPWQLVPFLLLYAPGYGGPYPLRPAIQAEHFGRRSFGAVQGVILTCNAAAGMAGPIFAGWVFDGLGSYRLALTVLAVVTALGVPAALAMPDGARPAPRRSPRPAGARAEARSREIQQHTG